MHRPKKPAPGFVPGPAARMPCIVGRAFTPAGRRRGGVAVLCKNRTVGSCNAARPGGYAEPGRVLAKPGAAPLSRLTPTAPLTGEPFRRQDLYKASPARGGGCAARRRRRGALPVCGRGILQGPAGPCPVSVGDDAGIVPETLRCRKAPGGGRERPPYNTRQTGGGTGNGRPPAPGQRGDPCVGPPSGLTCGC